MTEVKRWQSLSSLKLFQVNQWQKKSGLNILFHQTGRHLLPRMKIYEEVLPSAVPTGVHVGMGKHQARYLGSRWEIKLAAMRIQHV